MLHTREGQFALALPTTQRGSRDRATITRRHFLHTLIHPILFSPSYVHFQFYSTFPILQSRISLFKFCSFQFLRRASSRCSLVAHMERPKSSLSLRDVFRDRRATVVADSITDLRKTMNRFLTRKRAKKAPEPKPEIDISNALPEVDTFRQSLLLTGLSTRFSMLKEQDDPNSLIGKACDDSVLQPRRQSRLHEFGYLSRGLTDIDEVGSTHSLVRPFAEKPRAGSFASDGYGTEDETGGSIMSRSRPLGDGNVLFGGRQKVYMVPGNASETNLGGGLRGRALYDHDVAMSAFQRFRKEEKHMQPQNRTSKSTNGSNSPSKMSMHSISEQSSLKRQTSDSTSISSPSTNARSSTAATSTVSRTTSLGAPSAPASQASSPSFAPLADRSLLKSKRLYEQGLDRDIREQQSSSMTRLNSIQRGRGGNGRQTPDMMRSRPSVRDQNRRHGMRVPRSTSPTPGASPSETQITAPQWPLGPASTTQTQEPTLPKISASTLREQDEELDILQASIQPDDRGKATAMGVFNKPQQFSETKFLERTITLSQGRSQPSPVEEHFPEIATQTSAEDVPAEMQSAQPKQAEVASNAFSVFQRAANQLKAPTPIETLRKDSKTHTSPLLSPEPEHDTEDEDITPQAEQSIDDQLKGLEAALPESVSAPPMENHPAFRLQPSPQSIQDDLAIRKRPNFGLADAQALRTQMRDHSDSPSNAASKSGLSGLIRQHLRNESDASQRSFASSHYPDVPLSPLMTSDVPLPLDWRSRTENNLTVGHSIDEDMSAHSGYTHSNPWDLEEYEERFNREAGSVSSIDPQSRSDPIAQRSSTISSMRHDESNRISTVSGEPSWQQELKVSHGRSASTETTQERLAFQNELDNRRRAIQEKLRAQVEGEQRSNSPTPGRAGPFKGLEMLRSKSSRESFKLNKDRPLRALGLGSSTNLAGTREDERPYTNSSNDSYEPRSGRSASRPAMPRNNQSDGYQDSERQQSWVRSSEEEGRSRMYSTTSKGRSPSEPNIADKRARSGSIGNLRSRSRTGRHREIPEQDTREPAMPGAYPEPSPAIPEQYQQSNASESSFAMPHPAVRPNTDATDRSNGLGISSKPSSYFDARPAQSVPHLSPLTPATVGMQPSYTPNGLPISPRPSPGLISNYPLSPDALCPPVATTNVYHHEATPPLSASTSPQAPVFPPAHIIQAQAAHAAAFHKNPARKKSVQKSQISEPSLISTTSVVDTVDLPPGASLKNGMDEVEDNTPPVPAINPLRRRFGFAGLGKNEQLNLSSVAYADSARSNSTDDGDPTQWRPQRQATGRLNGVGIRESSPPLNERGMF